MLGPAAGYARRALLGRWKLGLLDAMGQLEDNGQQHPHDGRNEEVKERDNPHRMKEQRDHQHKSERNDLTADEEDEFPAARPRDAMRADVPAKDVLELAEPARAKATVNGNACPHVWSKKKSSSYETMTQAAMIAVLRYIRGQSRGRRPVVSKYRSTRRRSSVRKPLLVPNFSTPGASL